MNESLSLLEKAGRTLEAVELLCEKGYLESAASRLYYVWFYVAESLLLSRGLQFSSHSQVTAQYGNLFARTNLLDPKFHRLLLRAFNLRQMADYWTRVEISPEEVQELIQEGQRFITAARDFLEASPPDHRQG